MTLQELESTLPSGLHDAEIKSISVDYAKRQATIALAVWMEQVEAPDPRVMFRDATVTLDGLMFLAIEPPASDSFAEERGLQVDVTHDRRHLHVPAIAKLPSDCFVSGLFVQDWYSYIYVAARNASLVWTGEMYPAA